LTMTKIVRLDAPIVVGAGVAGLTVALGLRRAYVIAAREMGSTWWAQGGIAAAVGDDDSPQAHAEDTVAVSGGIAVYDAVEVLTSGGPEAIERLVRHGVEFDRDEDGKLLLDRLGGHGTSRIVHADGDATGAEIMRSLTEAVVAAGHVESIEERVVDLARSGDRVVGVLTADGKTRTVYTGPAVVMATGGAGRLYARTTNPPGVTGDGIMIASRAGASLADLEFVQFHPTALDAGKDPMPLLAEGLRSEGARLVDPRGRPFMDQYDPRADLAPRDVVARSILGERERGSSAYLDCRSIVNFHERFPTATAHALSVGLDPSDHLLPVSPAAHYYMGGIDTDTSGRTSIPGLWAVGECASTGVHGANRLASNSLLEGLVFGARVAADVEAHAGTEVPLSVEVPEDGIELPVVAGPALEDLRQVMWDGVGLIRSVDGMHEARSALVELERVLSRTSTGRNAAALGSLIISAALKRTESRGSHYRTDHPEMDQGQAVRQLTVPGAVDTVRVGG
ncbi:MAG: L-aspartate oxidase, partial [Actinomycetota bacterium]